MISTHKWHDLLCHKLAIAVTLDQRIFLYDTLAQRLEVHAASLGAHERYDRWIQQGFGTGDEGLRSALHSFSLLRFPPEYITLNL